jgi:hypothetical protein
VYSDGAFNADVWNSLVTSNPELHDNAPSTAPSSFGFIDTASTGGSIPTDTDPITDILSFIDNLPENLPTQLLPTQFPSLPDDIDVHLPPSNNGPTASFRSPLTINRPRGRLPSIAKGASTLPSAPEGGRLPLPSSPEGGRLPSSPKGDFRRSSRLRKPVDRLNLLNDTRNIDSKMFEMFDSTPCPKGSRQITFRKTDQPPRVTGESIN